MRKDLTANDIIAWTINAGLQHTSVATVVEGFADRLSEALPGLSRLFVGMPTLHPTFSAESWLWQRGRPTARERQRSADDNNEAYLTSPIHHVLQNNLQILRCILTDPADAGRFPMFRSFVDEGQTDYLLRMLTFENDTSASGIRGLAVSFVSNAPAGFNTADLDLIERVLPPLALAAFRLTLGDVARNLLSAYLGHNAGQRILGGRVRRGDVEQIRAAVLFADLRDFTTTTDRLPPERVIEWLDDGLAALGDPMARLGGEVLKFLGDGMLAIFPTDEGETDACRRALAAAVAGLDALDRLNREGDGAYLHRADVALHVGTVGYGNIGASDRLDFTVIGPTVNEASRMEALCDGFAVHLIMSDVFASHIDRPLRSLGVHNLRGVEAPRGIFTLTES